MNDQKELYNAIMDNCYQEGIFDYKLACSYISNNLSSAFKVDKDAISRLERQLQKYADNSRAHNILREINFMSVFRDTLRDYQNREELLSSKGESNTSANSYVYANKSLHELENIRMEKEFFQICGEYLKQKYLTEPYREVS